jgi:uncharacterized damage-inducible protein DinB
VGEVLRDVTDEQYRQKPVGHASGSIGGHVRHCLDHVDALLGGVAHGAIDYDRRLRGTEVETNRLAALESLVRQEQSLLAVPRGSEGRRLRLSTMIAAALPPVDVSTTVGRELAFVFSHTVHHNALIAVMTRTLGVPVPEHFGYAPSTIAHLETSACAR